MAAGRAGGRAIRRGRAARATAAAAIAGLLSLVGTGAEAEPILYVRMHTSSIALVDTTNSGVIGRVPLGLDGSGMVVHPSGASVYAHTLLSQTRNFRDERVAVVDVASRTVAAFVQVTSGVRQLALDPTGAFLYVATDASISASGIVVSSDPAVEVIDTRARLRVATIPLTPAFVSPDRGEVAAIALHPGGVKLYAARSVVSKGVGTDDIAVVDTAARAVVGTVPVTGLGAPLALDAAGSRLYTRSSDGVAVIDTATDTVVTTVALGCCLGSGRLVVHPAGSAVYAVAPGPDFESGQVSVIDTGANALASTISLGFVPRAAAVSPDGRRLYVAGDTGETCAQFPCAPRTAALAVIDTATNAGVATVALGRQVGVSGDSIAVHPAGTHVYVGFPGPDVFGRVAVVDATALAVVRSFPGFDVTLGPDLPDPPYRLHFHLVRSQDGVGASVQWGAPGDRPVLADFDGDGRADLVVVRPAEGEEESVWYVVRSSDGGVVRQQWGAMSLGDEPVPADYDGDGRADVAVWRMTEGAWYVRRSSDGGVVRHLLGSLDDIPVPADYDGDGRADFAVWRPGFTFWSIVGSASGQTTTFQFGAPGDVPVPADYDGDGKADVALWRPTTGEWFVRLSSSGATIGVAWGGPGDVPVPSDHDGDGRADFAIWRPSTGEWFIVRSSDGGVSYGVWGAPGDRPLPGDYDGDGGADLAVYRP